MNKDFFNVLFHEKYDGGALMGVQRTKALKNFGLLLTSGGQINS